MLANVKTVVSSMELYHSRLSSECNDVGVLKAGHAIEKTKAKTNALEAKTYRYCFLTDCLLCLQLTSLAVLSKGTVILVCRETTCTAFFLC